MSGAFESWLKRRAEDVGTHHATCYESHPACAALRSRAEADRRIAELDALAVDLSEAMQWFVVFHSGHVLSPGLERGMASGREALARFDEWKAGTR